MAEWRLYSDGDLPISVPPVDMAWEDMRSRLHNRTHPEGPLWRKLLLTTILLLSWLVILEPYRSMNHTAPIKPSSMSYTLPSLPSREQNKPSHMASTEESSPLPQKQLATSRSPKKMANPVLPDTMQLTGNSVPLTDVTDDNRQTDPTNVAGFTVSEPSDSTGKRNTVTKDSTVKLIAEQKEESRKEIEKWQFNAGLKWEAQIPTTGISGYFDGPNNKTQLWRSLIPGLFLEAVQGKNSLHFSFMPMHTQMVASKTFRIQNSLVQTNDTTISREENKQLYKLLGMSATIGYARNLHRNWWYGLSFEAAWWQQALATSDVKDTYIVGGQVNGQKDYSNRYKISEEWIYFNKMQIFLQGDLSYRKQRWQTGLSAGLALTPLSKGEGPASMFRGSISFSYSFLRR
jgi:hypothetical protein